MSFSVQNLLVARVWAVVLLAAAIATIVAAWVAFANFSTAKDEAVCALTVVNNEHAVANASVTELALAANITLDPSIMANLTATIDENLPSELLELVSENMGLYAALVCAPAHVSAGLLVFAAVHILAPSPPNPLCSKYTASLSIFVALFAVVIYLVFMVFNNVVTSDWATEQEQAFATACNMTSSINGSATAFLNVTDGECECLQRVFPALRSLWGPGLFAFVALLAAAVLGGALRLFAPPGTKTTGYGRGDVLLGRICLGEAGFWLNLICFPFVLLWHGTDIYLVGCLKVLGTRLFRTIFRPCLSVYHDAEWTGATALGGKDGAKGNVQWVRACEIGASKPAGAKKTIADKYKLYEGKIEPADLCQGAIGDCWLVAALASAAEQPMSIRNAFLTPEYNPLGRYDVRLYDPEAQDWVIITVDDKIPVDSSKQPLYMKMNGKELWAVMLEKAFAKFCGSYAHLDGGWAVWGWRVLTGDHCFRLSLENNKWSRTNFEAKKGKDGIDGAFRSTKESYTTDEAWALILNYIEAKGLLSASGGAQMGSGGGGANSGGLNGEQLNDNGLVGTHAYSILDARELGLIPGLSLGGGVLGQTRLVKMRNPWGRYEWKGAWSDKSKEWDENPLVKARLRPNLGDGADDGTFWMPFDKLVTGEAGFTKLDFCDRTTKRDLALKPKEDWGTCGIVWGAISGIVKFVLCCRGVAVIYLGALSSHRTKSTKRGCARCSEIVANKDVHDPAVVQVDVDHKVMSYA